MFSLILPVYKQADHAQQLYNDYTSLIAKYDCEIIFVVNGDTDNAAQILRQAANNSSKIHVVEIPEKGWGKAVKAGIEAAKGNWICYTNSARTRASHVAHFFDIALKNPDFVIKATRKIRTNWLRKIGSVLYNFLVRIVLNVPVWDINGTPKIFPAHVIKKISIYSDDDLIDAEIITLCCQHNVKIMEIPIQNTERLGGKSTTGVQSAWRMYSRLYRLKQRISK